MNHRTNTLTIFAKTKQRGFTLAELSVVAVIIGIIAVVGIVIAPQVLASIRANGEISTLPSITGRVQQRFYNQPTFANLTTAYVATANIVPNNMVSGTTVSNRWGGAVTFGPATVSNPNDGFTITEALVPDQECKEIVSAIGNNYFTVTVNASNVKGMGANLDETALNTACGSGTNTLVFTSGK